MQKNQVFNINSDVVFVADVSVGAWRAMPYALFRRELPHLPFPLSLKHLGRRASHVKPLIRL